MKNLREFKQINENSMTLGRTQGQRSVYKNMSGSDLSELDELCISKFGRPFMKCSFDEQATARSFLSELQEELDLFGSDEEEEEETDDKEEDTEPSEEEQKQNKFLTLLDDKNFISNIEKTLKQYVLENLLVDSVNSFKIIPFVDFTYKDENYGLSVEFDTPCIMNFDKKNKISETDLGEIGTINYTTPEIDNLNVMDSEKGITIISSMVIKTLSDIHEKLS